MIRSSISWLGAAALGMLVLGGCSNKEAVKLAEDISTKMCACKDAKCAADVDKELLEVQKKLGDAKGTDGDKKKISAAMTKYQDCRNKAMTGGEGEKPAEGEQPAENK